MQQLGEQRRKEAETDEEDAFQHAGAPAQAQGEIPLPVRRHGPTAAIDDKQPLLRDDGDDRRRGHSPDPPVARPDLEHLRRVVRVAVRENPLDRATAAACEGEPDTVGEPVAGDRARGVEPPTLAQCNRHHARLPHYPAMRNSLS